MTKKEFKAKIESQKEGMCKQHDHHKKALKFASIISGSFIIAGLAGTIIWAATDFKPLQPTCDILLAASTGVAYGLWIGNSSLEREHEEDKIQLDEILNNVDNIKDNNDDQENS